MKRTLIVLAAMIMLAGFTTNAIAQNSATTGAAAKIVQALTLTKVYDLNFGTMAIPTGAVNVVLGTDGSRTASVPANITLLSQAPVAQRAYYTIAGTATSTYAITLPADGAVTIASGSNSMAVNAFKAKPTSAGVESLTGSLDGSGADNFYVGATLVLTNAQAYGSYTGTFNVSVNYN